MYNGYKGGYASLTYCPECNRVALYEDAHPVVPCSSCGGTVHEGFSGKWVSTANRSIFSPSSWFDQSGVWSMTSVSLEKAERLFDGVEVLKESAHDPDSDFFSLDFTTEKS